MAELRSCTLAGRDACSAQLTLFLPLHLSHRTGERRRRGKGDRRATEITKAIRNCLEQTILVELMPRSQIDVYVQVMQVGSLRGVE